MTSGTDARLLLGSVALLVLAVAVRANVTRLATVFVPLLNLSTVAAGVLVSALLAYVAAARRVLLLTAMTVVSLLIAAACIALIANYRAQFDMEMTYTEMVAHVRVASGVLACAVAVAAASLYRMLRKLRRSGTPGVPPN